MTTKKETKEEYLRRLNTEKKRRYRNKNREKHNAYRRELYRRNKAKEENENQ